MKTYIVIPVYIINNLLRELTIEAIISFRNNSKDTEIIAVNDASPMDASFLKDIVDIYIENKENLGFAKTCNKGIKKAISKLGKNDGYIVCANNDIEVYNGWQEAMIEPFTKYENVGVTGICHSKLRMIDGIHLSDLSETKITEGGLIGEQMQDGGLWMSKKSILKEVGLFDERFVRGGHEDIDLFLRMRDNFNKKLIMSAKSWYWHREGSTRFTEQDSNFDIESRAIEVENRKRFIDKWGYDPHTRQIWFSKEIIS